MILLRVWHPLHSRSQRPCMRPLVASGLFFRKQQQSVVKKFVKKGQREHKEMDATKDITSIFMLPFEGYCKKYYILRVIFQN